MCLQKHVSSSAKCFLALLLIAVAIFLGYWMLIKDTFMLAMVYDGESKRFDVIFLRNESREVSKSYKGSVMKIIPQRSSLKRHNTSTVWLHPKYKVKSSSITPIDTTMLGKQSSVTTLKHYSLNQEATGAMNTISSTGKQTKISGTTESAVKANVQASSDVLHTEKAPKTTHTQTFSTTSGIKNAMKESYAQTSNKIQLTTSSFRSSNMVSKSFSITYSAKTLRIYTSTERINSKPSDKISNSDSSSKTFTTTSEAQPSTIVITRNPITSIAHVSNKALSSQKLSATSNARPSSILTTQKLTKPSSAFGMKVLPITSGKKLSFNGSSSQISDTESFSNPSTASAVSHLTSVRLHTDISTFTKQDSTSIVHISTKESMIPKSRMSTKGQTRTATTTNKLSSKVPSSKTSIQASGSQMTTSPPAVTSTKPNRTHFYVCPEPSQGGIGNVMFEFASAYAVARVKNMTVVVAPSYSLNQYFTLEADIRKDSKTICKNAKGRRAAYHIKYDANLTHFKADHDFRIGIYLQSWMYFKDVESDIRKQFTFKSPIKTKAESIINKTIRKHKFKSRSDVILVGIHIRRGDFVNNSFGYSVATPEYLRKSVLYFTQKFINVLFIVCTNDIKWTKENMPSGITVAFMENNPAEVDMCILTMCDHTIISVGTFGWWAAWLKNRGETIFFKWPAKEKSKLRKHFSADYSDFFPPKWIGM